LDFTVHTLDVSGWSEAHGPVEHCTGLQLRPRQCQKTLNDTSSH